MKRFCAVVLAVFFLSIVNFSYAQEFSSNIVTKTKDGVTNGKFYVSKDRLRLEIEPAVTVTRIDKKIVWMILPEQKTYLEMPMESQDMVPTLERVPGEKKRTVIGTETIEGRETRKYEVVFDSQGKEEVIYLWMSEELNFPVKSAALDDSWSVEYKDIVPGAQPPELFELPADYTKFDYGKTPAETQIDD